MLALAQRSQGALWARSPLKCLCSSRVCAGRSHRIAEIAGLKRRECPEQPPMRHKLYLQVEAQ